MKNIERLGFQNWFQDKIDKTKSSEFQIVRVITVNKNSYIVSDGRQDIYAELTGKFIFHSDSPIDLPAVGDWVYAHLFDNDDLAIIHDIFPRKSLLKRKTPGKKIEYQSIAANIDIAIIMQSVDQNYNLRRLERYVVMIKDSRIQPLLLLSKSDLSTPDEIEKKIKDIQTIMADIPIVFFSNKIESDIINIQNLFDAGKTYCLLGSSGVGKTTLLNNLIKKKLYKTQAIREKDGRGRHTTSRRELIVLDNGAIVIDTPGMRELGLINIKSGLEDTFKEIIEITNECLFNNCTHTIEKGCAILNALEDGTISKERYDNYIKMCKESSYHEMSYLEKRQKDKLFGKYIRSVMKHHKNKG